MMNSTQTGQGERTLWERILELLEENLAERRDRRLYVELRAERGSYQKEIGELSTPDIRSLQPWLREHVVERLVDRYLAEQDRVDLLGRRRAYTKDIWDLTPEDLPAVLEADRYRTEEHRKERERVEFVRQVIEELDQFCIVEPSWMSLRAEGTMERTPPLRTQRVQCSNELFAGTLPNCATSSRSCHLDGEPTTTLRRRWIAVQVGA